MSAPAAVRARDVVREAERICRASAAALGVLEDLERTRQSRARTLGNVAAVIGAVCVLFTVALVVVAG